MSQTKCFFHPDNEAVLGCEECGKPICNLCKRTIDRGNQRETLGGRTEVIHSYHNVCPECQAKFKGKVKNLKIFGFILLIPVLILIFIRYMPK